MTIHIHKAARYALVCASLWCMTARAQAPDPQAQARAIAQFAAHLLLDEKVITPDQLAQLLDNNNPQNPISQATAADVLGMGVYRDSFEQLLAKPFDKTVLSNLLMPLMGQKSQETRHKRADTFRTALPFGLKNFTYLQADTLISPDDSTIRWQLPDDIWLQRNHMTTRQWVDINHIQANFIEGANIDRRIIFTRVDLEHHDIRAALDHLNQQLPPGFPVQYDIATSSELGYALAAGLARVYQDNPALLHVPHAVDPAFADTLGMDALPQPAKSAFLTRYGDDDMNASPPHLEPLRVQNKRVWGLLSPVKTLCGNSSASHTAQPITFFGTPGFSHLGQRSGQSHHKKNNPYLPHLHPFQYWYHLLSEMDFSQNSLVSRSLYSIRLVLRKRTAQLRYKDL